MAKVGIKVRPTFSHISCNMIKQFSSVLMSYMSLEGTV